MLSRLWKYPAELFAIGLPLLIYAYATILPATELIEHVATLVISLKGLGFSWIGSCTTHCGTDFVSAAAHYVVPLVALVAGLDGVVRYRGISQRGLFGRLLTSRQEVGRGVTACLVALGFLSALQALYLFGFVWGEAYEHRFAGASPLRLPDGYVAGREVVSLMVLGLAMIYWTRFAAFLVSLLQRSRHPKSSCVGT